MSLPAPISITNQANMLGKWLDEWVAPRGGVTKILANTRHLWEEIYGQSTDSQPRVLIIYMGEDSRGGFNERNTLHRVDRQWSVVVMRGHGFDNAMNKTEPGIQTTFYDDVETIRELIRCLTSMSEEEPIDYKAIRPLPGVAQPNMANVFLDGYSIEFSTANDIPAITRLAPGQDSES